VIRHFLNPPNWFTSASLFCSTYAMALLITGDGGSAVLSKACVLVIFGGVFDLLDGRVARLTGRFSEFGLQLDTIADVVGFGVAPALIVYTWCLQDLGMMGALVAFWYVLATAFRLARFNVAKAEEGWGLRGHSQGVTSTMAGGSLVTLVWVCNDYLLGVFAPSALTVAAIVAFVGLLMVTSIPFRNFRDLRDNKIARRWMALALASCLIGAVALDISMWWGIGAVLYLTLGLADGIVVAIHHRRLSKALLLDEIEEALTEGVGDDRTDEVLID